MIGNHAKDDSTKRIEQSCRSDLYKQHDEAISNNLHYEENALRQTHRRQKEPSKSLQNLDRPLFRHVAAGSTMVS